MKRSPFLVVISEMVLILGSIPVFRSVWMALDACDFMNRRVGIGLSFGAGLLLCVAALFALNTRPKEKPTNDRENAATRGAAGSDSA